MKSRILILCMLWTGALHAGPGEDVRQADTLLRHGDLPGAMALLRQAADRDHPLAMARLGDLLRAAEFENEAVVLYRKSAERGEPAGQVGLGRAYADGAGVPRDDARALALYRQAEQQGYGPAFDVLARAYRTGTLGLARDPQQAESYQRKADAARRTAEAK